MFRQAHKLGSFEENTSNMRAHILKEKISSSLKSPKNLIFLGFGFALLFMIIESCIYAFVFKKGNLIDQIFTVDLDEIWIRFLVIFILLLFSIYVQFLVNRLSQSRKEIKLAYKKLNQIFNTEVDGIRVIDKDFNMLLMNEKFSILSGVRKDEAVGKKCYEVFRGQFCHTYRCPLNRILSGEKHVECDVEKVRKDGTDVLCILTAVPFLGTNGEIIGIVEDLKDITERERIRMDLRESEKKFRDLANLLPQTVFEIDQDGKITYFNKYGFDSFGCTRKDIDNGLNILQMFIPENREKVKENIGKRLVGKEIENNEYTALRKDGTFFPVVIFSSPIIQGDKSIGLRGIVVDITERKELEKSLEKVASEWNNTFDAISSQISLIDINQRILRCNKSMAEFLGKSFSEIVGHRVCDLIPHNIESGDAEECPFNIMKKTQQRESRVFLQDDRWISVIVEPFLDNSGNVIGAVHIMNDITESKLAEEKLKSSTKQLHVLTSHLLKVREEERIQVSRELHDELSPLLTVLKMGIVTIADRLSRYKDNEEFEELIKRAYSMKNTLTDSVIMVRKIITQLRPGILDTLGLIPAIEWQIEEFQENSRINCNLSSNLDKVALNSNESTAVFRIFQETLTNIARHAGASNVDIILEREDQCFIIEVEDDGYGISRADINGRESFGIMGMRERANLYGWNLNISGIEGKGTKVTLKIPLEGKEHE